jgi:hypothetical protein
MFSFMGVLPSAGVATGGADFFFRGSGGASAAGSQPLSLSCCLFTSFRDSESDRGVGFARENAGANMSAYRRARGRKNFFSHEGNNSE